MSIFHSSFHPSVPCPFLLAFPLFSFISILCFYRWFLHLPLSPFVPSFFPYLSTSLNFFPFFPVLVFPSCLFSSFQECSYWKKRERKVREADYRCLPLFAWLCFKSKYIGYLLLPFCCSVLIFIIMDVCVYLINVSLANCSWHFLSQFFFSRE